MSFIEQLPFFYLVLIRMSSFFLTAPVFTNQGVPAVYKIGVGFFLSLLTFSVVGAETGTVSPPLDGLYIMLVLKEAIVGLVLGFIAKLLLYAVQVAGGFIDIQVGFAIANVIDPQTGAQSPLTGNFKYILAILFLLSLNGHHMLIKGILTSYEAIPVGVMWEHLNTGSVAQLFVDTFVYMFTSAFMMAIPIVGSLFLVDVALGIIARTVPQMNVFIIGLPLKIAVSFAVMLIVLPGYFYLLKLLFAQMYKSMAELMKLLGG